MLKAQECVFPLALQIPMRRIAKTIPCRLDSREEPLGRRGAKNGVQVVDDPQVIWVAVHTAGTCRLDFSCDPLQDSISDCRMHIR